MKIRKSKIKALLRPVFIAALSVGRAQRSALRYAQLEDTEVRDDRYGS